MHSGQATRRSHRVIIGGLLVAVAALGYRVLASQHLIVARARQLDSVAVVAHVAVDRRLCRPSKNPR